MNTSTVRVLHIARCSQCPFDRVDPDQSCGPAGSYCSKSSGRETPSMGTPSWCPLDSVEVPSAKPDGDGATI